MLNSKIEHFQLNFQPFRTVFSGMDRVLHLAWSSIFFDFYFVNFCGRMFRMHQ